MKNRAILIVGLLLAAYYILPAYAKSATDVSVVSVGARSVGMGRAGVAVVSTANNVFVNPSSIASTKSFELTSMSTQLMGLVDYRFLSGNLKLSRGVLGLSYVGATTPAGFYTTDENSVSGASAINYGSSVIALSYATKLNDLMKVRGNLGDVSVGANIKYFNEGFSGALSSSGTGVSADLAMLYEVNPSLSWGLNLQNISGGKINWASSSEDIPSLIKAGGALKLLGGKALLAVDTDFAQGRPVVLHGGLEWKPVDLLALRAGLDQDASSPTSTVSNVTAGVGINLRGFQIDLAYRQDATLQDNSNFYLSLSYAPDFSVRSEVGVKPEAAAVKGVKETKKEAASPLDAFKKPAAKSSLYRNSLGLK